MNDLLPWHLKTWNHIQEARRQNRLPHALLITGALGLGKARFARQLAESLLCEQPQEHGLACGHCRQCQLLHAQSHPDLRMIVPEEGKAQIGIDAVRALVAGNTLSVGRNAYRVFIIDPAESMGRAAANALLKTLEEPIEGTLIVLLSARIDRLPITIRSRCQLLKLAAPAEDDAIAWIESNTPAGAGKAAQLLQLANGAPLRAPDLIESGALEKHNRLLDDFVAIAMGKTSAVQVSEVWLKENQPAQLLVYMASWLMAVIRQKMIPQAETAFPGLQSLLERLDLRLAYRLLDKLYETERASMNNLNPQLALESILLEWSRVANGES
ncbi:DNA polymerase III subunit delta' [Thiolapillus sp.]